MSFLDGGTALCTVAISNNGVATCTTNGFALGSHNLTASYAGDANNASNISPALSEAVKQAPQVVLEVSPDPATVTSAVTVKLTSSANNGLPTAGVSFLDGNTVLGTGSLNGQGIATVLGVASV